MDRSNADIKLVERYIALLKDLSAENKRDLIAKLSQSVKAEKDEDQSDFYKAFGGWDENESAEELINTIKESRTFDRTIEEF